MVAPAFSPLARHLLLPCSPKMYHEIDRSPSLSLLSPRPFLCVCVCGCMIVCVCCYITCSAHRSLVRSNQGPPPSQHPSVSLVYVRVHVSACCMSLRTWCVAPIAVFVLFELFLKEALKERATHNRCLHCPAAAAFVASQRPEVAIHYVRQLAIHCVGQQAKW